MILFWCEAQRPISRSDNPIMPNLSHTRPPRMRAFSILIRWRCVFITYRRSMQLKTDISKLKPPPGNCIHLAVDKSDTGAGGNEDQRFTDRWRCENESSEVLQLFLFTQAKQSGASVLSTGANSVSSIERRQGVPLLGSNKQTNRASASQIRELHRFQLIGS